ncbi:hypothetical protein FGO68_gene11004 [Halteria grandinella]|uniref:Uncharacterized protein n=1 Tax=Halteria grandinella TaxID=5974 RepID=A0A8J8P3S7_HALGN|nr:hypothetical protein FGO68_gene11004 [Halteria grandinella]
MQAIWPSFTIVSILFSLILQRSLQACANGQAPFPKIVGGTSLNTYFDQIDYNQVTDHLVAVGNTNDQGVRGDASSAFSPIVIAYQYNQYKWGKIFPSMINDNIYGVNINRQGTRLVVSNYDTNRYLIVMDITNGNVIASTQFTVSVYYDYYRRNLLLLEDGKIVIGDDTRIIQIAPSSTSATTLTLSGYSTIGLLSNTAQSYLHVYSFAANICMITVLDMVSFTGIYQYQAQCASTSADDLAKTFQSCIFETSATAETIVFQEGTRFFRVHNQYSPSLLTTSTVHATTTLFG